jgi:hypothetical protein
MQPSDWIQLVSSLILTATLIAIALQFRAARRANTLLLETTRHQLYLAMANSISQDTMSAMKLHAADHFDLDVFVKRYANHEDRINSYFLMKMKYIYMAFAIFHIGRGPREKLVRDSFAPWIQELGSYHEFYDVHNRHKKYYPEFAKWVDALITSVPTPVRSWMVDSAKQLPTSLGMPVKKAVSEEKKGRESESEKGSGIESEANRAEHS